MGFINRLFFAISGILLGIFFSLYGGSVSKFTNRVTSGAWAGGMVAAQMMLFKFTSHPYLIIPAVLVAGVIGLVLFLNASARLPLVAVAFTNGLLLANAILAATDEQLLKSAVLRLGILYVSAVAAFFAGFKIDKKMRVWSAVFLGYQLIHYSVLSFFGIGPALALAETLSIESNSNCKFDWSICFYAGAVVVVPLMSKLQKTLIFRKPVMPNVFVSSSQF